MRYACLWFAADVDVEVDDVCDYMLMQPTSGLSATDSLVLMEFLHEIAHLLNITIILTIHQPRHQVFTDCLDQVLIMDHTGHQVFFGPPGDITQALHEIGAVSKAVACGEDDTVNPADSLLDVLSATKPTEALRECWTSKQYGVAVDAKINEEIRTGLGLPNSQSVQASFFAQVCCC